MMQRMIDLKCTSCGAELSVEETREELFCQYCGTKNVLRNDNEQVYRHIDEAGLKRAETDRIVQLKKIEMAEKENEQDKKNRANKIKLAITLGIVGIVMMIVGMGLGQTSGNKDSWYYYLCVVGFFPLMGSISLWTSSKKKDRVLIGQVVVPNSISGYKSKNYQSIEAQLQGAGFQNIKCVPLKDLTFGLLKKPGMVESIVINGDNVTTGGGKYDQNDLVIISYHSLPDKER